MSSVWRSWMRSGVSAVADVEACGDDPGSAAVQAAATAKTNAEKRPRTMVDASGWSLREDHTAGWFTRVAGLGVFVDGRAPAARSWRRASHTNPTMTAKTSAKPRIDSIGSTRSPAWSWLKNPPTGV